MTNSATDKLVKVLSQVFGIPPEQINDDTSPDSVDGWDSVSHINLVLALEKEFNVSLSPDQAMEMLSVKLIKMILVEVGVQI